MSSHRAGAFGRSPRMAGKEMSHWTCRCILSEKALVFSGPDERER